MGAPPGWLQLALGGAVRGLQPCACFPYAVTSGRAANKQTVKTDIHAHKEAYFRGFGGVGGKS